MKGDGKGWYAGKGQLPGPPQNLGAFNPVVVVAAVVQCLLLSRRPLVGASLTRHQPGLPKMLRWQRSWQLGGMLRT